LYAAPARALALRDRTGPPGDEDPDEDLRSVLVAGLLITFLALTLLRYFGLGIPT
jgi:hypothetical protein